MPLAMRHYLFVRAQGDAALAPAQGKCSQLKWQAGLSLSQQLRAE